MSHSANPETASFTGVQKIVMDLEHWESMRIEIVNCLPKEACGILGGIGERVRIVLPVRNELQSPIRFRMDPLEQLAALQRIDQMGLEMIGIFHSHVHGPEYPSETDLAESYYPHAAYLIWSPRGEDWTCRSFRLIEGSAIEIPVLVNAE